MIRLPNTITNRMNNTSMIAALELNPWQGHGVKHGL